MNRLSDELRVIPKVAWLIAVLMFGCMFSLLLFVAMPSDPKLRLWPLAGQIAFAIWPGIIIGLWALLIGYINGDAPRHGMRRGLWTFVAFLPNFIGIILYFVMREPLLAPCPKCAAPARAGFTFCPQCGAELARSCPSCKRAVEPAWKRCAYCGTALAQGSVATTPPPPMGANA